MYLMDFTRVVHLDPSRGLATSRAPELHWQLALTRRGSPPKIIFWKSLHLLVSTREFMNLRGRNSAYYDYKTNILDFELRVGPWNCMSAETQAKHGRAQFFFKL